MMINKVNTHFVEGPKGAKTSEFGIFWGSMTFLPVGTRQPHQTRRKVYLEHPTKFQAKILTWIFYLRKNQNIH